MLKLHMVRVGAMAASISALMLMSAPASAKDDPKAVSYTHLTLPTNREV